MPTSAAPGKPDRGPSTRTDGTEMATTLRQTDADFEQRFTAFLGAKRESSADVDAVVR